MGFNMNEDLAPPWRPIEGNIQMLKFKLAGKAGREMAGHIAGNRPGSQESHKAKERMVRISSADDFVNLSWSAGHTRTVGRALWKDTRVRAMKLLQSELLETRNLANLVWSYATCRIQEPRVVRDFSVGFSAISLPLERHRVSATERIEQRLRLRSSALFSHIRIRRGCICSQLKVHRVHATVPGKHRTVSGKAGASQRKCH
eukprot:s817_g7.t1